MGNIKVFKIFLHDQIGVIWVVSSSGFLNMWSGVRFQLMYIEIYHLGKVALTIRRNWECQYGIASSSECGEKENPVPCS